MAEVVAFAAHLDARTFGEGVGDVFLHFFHRFGINHRTLRDAGIYAVADVQLPHRVGEFLCESIINAALHIQAVRADAGLTGVAVFGGNRAFDRCIQIGVVKYDERRVATQLHRNFFHCWRALFNQLATHFGGAGE